MGWGEAQGPTPADKTIRLADRLAAAVRSWVASPTTNNAEHMEAALWDYENTLR